MLDKLEKLEEKVNELIDKLKILVIGFIYKIIPQKFLDLIAYTKLKSKTKITHAATKAKKKLVSGKEKAITAKNKVATGIDTAQNYPVKSKLLEFLENLKTLLLKTPLKNHAQFISDKLKGYVNAIDALMDRFGKPQLAFTAIVFCVMSIGFYGAYHSANQIIEEEFPNRAPASVQEYAHRPEYKGYKKRTMQVRNIQVPIFKENINSVRSITIDFTVRTSTRFAKQYLEFYEPELKDYFFTNVEPVVSSFPLEEEGKQILKEKIIYELNHFLKHKKVEGVVEDVRIVFINAN